MFKIMISMNFWRKKVGSIIKIMILISKMKATN